MTDAYFPCAGLEDLMFDDTREAEAKEICRPCLYRERCLAMALAFGPGSEGVWGGTSARERRRMLTQRRAARVAATPDPLKPAQARRLHRNGVPMTAIAVRLGEPRAKVIAWCQEEESA